MDAYQNGTRYKDQEAAGKPRADLIQAATSRGSSSDD